MVSFQFRVTNWLLSLSRKHKHLIVFTNDAVILLFALWASFSLRLGFFFLPTGADQWALALLTPVVMIMALKLAGAYRRINRHVGRTGAKRTLTGLTLGILAWSLLVWLSGVDIITSHGIPRSIPLIYLALSFLFIWTNREIASWYLTSHLVDNSRTSRSAGRNTDFNQDMAPKKILIWGYSEMALQLAHNLQLASGYEPVGIIDEDKSLHFLKADDIKIFPPDYLDELIPKEQISEIFLDNKILSKEKQLDIVRLLDAYSVTLKVLPSVEDIATGNIAVNEVKKIRVEDLLGRNPVPPQEHLIKGSVEGKSILVTGAGGSIGSELVRQLVLLGPAKLILFEISEAALYQIHSEIVQTVEALSAAIDDPDSPCPPQIEAMLGSVLDSSTIAHIIKDHKVQTIYHAAAYKHVPLVERNAVAGLKNNTLGTWNIARVAKENRVERFILISTDKAVRPTNIMGASKRLAEMILQSMSDQSDCRTVFCMVRFGNVLDSSGSVVPKFREQIAKGGPVTVTHPDINRYFMLTSEAVELVIQAGTLAQKGAVFVLDMGEPIKIKDLAYTMINLAGKSICNEENPDGDIAIEYTGLRPGEKLYEELLIGGNTSPTEHPRIQQLDEPFEQNHVLVSGLSQLEKSMIERNLPEITDILTSLVEGYQKEPLADHIDAQ